MGTAVPRSDTQKRNPGECISVLLVVPMLKRGELAFEQLRSLIDTDMVSQRQRRTGRALERIRRSLAEGHGDQVEIRVRHEQEQEFTRRARKLGCDVRPKPSVRLPSAYKAPQHSW